MYIGADYYPEHWPRERWETDARLMRKAGFNVTRLAEFAWVMMEPEEGRYEFGWLEEALAVLGNEGISAILCTPTAVAPAWAPRKYPEIMKQNQDGSRSMWGVRKDQCYTSGAYHRLSRDITRAMAEHFAKTPNVIGWQTDNEFDGRPCWCDTCRAEFQDWLRRKYKTIDAFNRAMGRWFWGHYAGTWGEIELPYGDGGHSPHLCMEWRRFGSDLDVRFQREQVKILREVCPGHFITHNMMGLWPPQLNYYDLGEDLDVVAWDNYPIGTAGMPPYSAGAAGDLMRGVKRKNYWIMETTSGPHGWGQFGRNPRPGEMRTWAFQQYAHGADNYVWFRWRACTAGREQYWHGILGHDGRPLRRYRETAAIAKELRGLEKELAGTTVKAKVGMIFDYDSRWAVDFQPGYSENNYVQSVLRYHDALTRAGVNVDMVKPGADLSGYRLVLAPNLYVMPDALARQIDAYVKGGGVFFCDLRTGVKDETGLCHTRTLPGLLSAALGIEIEEYESVIAPDNYKMVGADGFGGEYTADKGADWVTAKKARTVAAYDHWNMRPFAALTRNEYGRGIGWYAGTVAKEKEFYDRLVAAMLKDAKVRAVVKPPAGVEASVREGKGKRLLFLVNFTEEKKEVAVPAGKKELLTGKKTGQTLVLPRYGVAVVKL